MAYRNKTLGKFQLVDLPPAPRGVPQIEVTFDIDANGIVHVSAKDRATGKEQSMTITGQSALNRDEIDRMMREAESHAEEDRKRREEAEVRNNADTLVYQTEKLLKEQGEKATPEDKTAIEDALKSVKEALAGTDVDAIKTAHESLISASQNFASRLYQQAAANAQGGRAGPGGPAATGRRVARRARKRWPTPRSSTRARGRNPCPPTTPGLPAEEVPAQDPIEEIAHTPRISTQMKWWRASSSTKPSRDRHRVGRR